MPANDISNKKKFEKAAKELGCDTSDDALDRAFDGMDMSLKEQDEKQNKPKTTKKGKKKTP